MKLQLFHLEARAPFHIGERGVGLEESLGYAPSDTLFSALCTMVRLIESVDVLKQMLAEFGPARQPPFLCSGAYPYAKLPDRVVRFYPAPFNLRFIEDKDWVKPYRAKDKGKDVRKAHWMSEMAFDAWIQGRFEPARLCLYSGCLVTSDEDKALEKAYQGQRPWQVSDAPRVTVDRESNASAVYQVGRLVFEPGCGLWCAFAIQRREWLDRLERLLEQLGETGLGGERSSGHGQFTVVSPITREMPDVASQGHFVSLSHYHPRREERGVLGGDAVCQLETRRGWMASPENSALRREAVRMIAAGSVLPVVPDQKYYGDLVDVTPGEFKKQPGSHPVYRYGYALPIGVRLFEGAGSGKGAGR